MKKYFFVLLLTIFSAMDACTQNLATTVCGTYRCNGAGYENFVFSTAGEVFIDGSLTDAGRDYFQYNDTLVIYPDKDVFRFIVQKDGSLKGISNWVADSTWHKITDDTIHCEGLTGVTQSRLQLMYSFEQAMLLANSKTRTEADNEKIIAMLETGCSNNYGRACNKLGILYLFAAGVEKSLQAWDKGCLNNDANCCKNIADEYKERKDLSKAKTYYEKACALGDFGACNWDFGDKLKNELKRPAKKKVTPVKKRTSK
jgi:tetratricopeptide (TPR) repeat protein